MCQENCRGQRAEGGGRRAEGGRQKTEGRRKGIKGIRLVLEDGTSSSTDDSGRFRFANISPGKHALSLDLSSLPVDYLPKVPVKKEMTVYEGMSYNYNIPCQRQPSP